MSVTVNWNLWKNVTRNLIQPAGTGSSIGVSQVRVFHSVFRDSHRPEATGHWSVARDHGALHLMGGLQTPAWFIQLRIPVLVVLTLPRPLPRSGGATSSMVIQSGSHLMMDGKRLQHSHSRAKRNITS